MHRGQWIDFQRRGLRGRAEAEPAEGVAIKPALLVEFTTVTVAAAVLLINRKFQAGSAGETGNRFGALEDCAMLCVPTDRNRRRRPAAFLRVAVDCIGDAESGRLQIRQRPAELDLVRHCRIVQRADLASEFLEQKTSFGHEAGPAVGKVRVQQRFQAKAGDI